MPHQPKHLSQLLAFNLTKEAPIRLAIGDSLPSDEIVYLHWHNCFELALCLEGNGIFSIPSEGIQNVSSGDVYVISPGILHYSRSENFGNSKWLWAYFNFSLLLAPFPLKNNWKFLEQMTTCRYVNLIRGGGEIRELLLQLYRNREDLEDCRAWGFLLARRLEAMFVQFMQKEQLLLAPAPYRPIAPERIQKALILISRNFSSKLTVEELARECGMSENNFRRVFYSTTGVSPLQYLHQYRCAIAKSYLLNNQFSITEIAYKCGYPTISSFNRQFKQLVGVSPRAFRQNRC